MKNIQAAVATLKAARKDRDQLKKQIEQLKHALAAVDRHVADSQAAVAQAYEDAGIEY